MPYSTVGVTVRRVWVRADAGGDGRRVQCGATLIASGPRAMDAWKQMLANAPAGAGILAAPAIRPAPAKVAPDRLFGRVAQMVADTPLMGSLSLPWRGRS